MSLFKINTLIIIGIFIGTLAAPQAFSQQSEASDIYIMAEDMPRPIGGLWNIQRKVKVPRHLKEQGVSGKVYVVFVVDEKGTVKNTEVIRSMYPELDEEVERAVMNTKFFPGKQDGVPVKVKMSLPITVGSRWGA